MHGSFSPSHNRDAPLGNIILLPSLSGVSAEKPLIAMLAPSHSERYENPHLLRNVITFLHGHD